MLCLLQQLQFIVRPNLSLFQYEFYFILFYMNSLQLILKMEFN